jgi:parallel beta-helix repeat protein
MVSLLVISALTLAFNIQPARSDYVWTETIYIRADGSIEPTGAPVSTVDNVTYTLTDNIVGEVPYGSSAVIVERNNIVVDGADHAVLGTAYYSGTGTSVIGNNVTIKNMEITKFWCGVCLNYSSGNIVSGNNMTDNGGYGLSGGDGICLYYSSNNIISENNMTGNHGGIEVFSALNNVISGNSIRNNRHGISLADSSGNIISGNDLTRNYYGGIHLAFSSNNSISGNTIDRNSGYGFGTYGIRLYSSVNNSITGNNLTRNGWDGISLLNSSHNTISGNTIEDSWYGISFEESSNNEIYHNSFVSNDYQVYDYSWNDPEIMHSVNRWDDGFPSGGNYWSNYEEKYPNATEIDGSGIWDTPYYIDENNQDDYPIIPEFLVAMLLPLLTITTLLVVIISLGKKHDPE